LIAVPYRANNTPTGFAYAAFLEAFNYTAQMYYCEGVRYEIFNSLLKSWQADARNDRLRNPDRMSAAERKFNHVFVAEKLSLITLDLDNKKLVEDLHKKYNRHPVLIDRMVKDSFSTLTIDRNLLRCDAINLAGMFNRVYAFSATPDNYRTFHPKIQMASETSFLIASRVKDYLKTKNTKLKVFDSTNPKDFIFDCIAEHPRMRVLLDCGSRLLGISNLEVAKVIASIYAVRNKNMEDNEKPIRYVLFYQKDSLYALGVDHAQDAQPKKLTNTDAATIERELENCSPEERFTYLDQEHTVGVDILQWAQAVGLATVDVKTGISAFLQAVMRMRQLGEQQQVVVALDSALINKVQEDSVLNLDKLFDVLEKNQLTQLEIDHYSSTLKNIANVFREDFLRHLLNEDDRLVRDKKYRAAQRFFIEKQSDDIAELYLVKCKRLDAATIFDKVVAELLAEWKVALREGGTSEVDIACSEERIKKTLNVICERGVKISRQEQFYPLADGGREVQQQKQKEKQKEKEKEQELANQDESLRILKPDLRWLNDAFRSHL
ncbi:MAG TPA: hypothetical protein VHA13_05190, partial [Gammaproteobacteria bacterium]|nr:hypothetical protein [Gammaproteobacteria bacterium]